MLCVTCHGFITQISPGSSLAKPGGFPGIIGFNWQEFVLVLFSQVCSKMSKLLVQNSKHVIKKFFFFSSNFKYNTSNHTNFSTKPNQRFI